MHTQIQPHFLRPAHSTTLAHPSPHPCTATPPLQTAQGRSASSVRHSSRCALSSALLMVAAPHSWQHTGHATAARPCCDVSNTLGLVEGWMAGAEGLGCLSWATGLPLLLGRPAWAKPPPPASAASARWPLLPAAIASGSPALHTSPCPPSSCTNRRSAASAHCLRSCSADSGDAGVAPVSALSAAAPPPVLLGCAGALPAPVPAGVNQRVMGMLPRPPPGWAGAGRPPCCALPGLDRFTAAWLAPAASPTPPPPLEDTAAPCPERSRLPACPLLPAVFSGSWGGGRAGA